MEKKWIIFCMLILVFGLFGCSDDEADDSSGSAASVASESSLVSGGSSSSSAVASSSAVPVAISFSGLTANGTSGSVTTTELTLAFDKEPVGLALGDITLTGATKGVLSGSGTSWTLTISAITVYNGGEVKVTLANPTGYSIDPSSKSVVVYLQIAGGIQQLDDVEKRDLVIVPGGIYSQQPVSGNTFTHTVSSFRMAKYQVTYELWHTVYTWVTNNGYYFANPGREGSGGTDGATPTSRKYEPVTYINWRDAIVWCNAYSEVEGLEPVYCTDGGFTSPIRDSRDGAYGSSVKTAAGSFDKPYINWNATGYRLPTEGEWQYAASYKDDSSWTPYNYASGATADYNDAIATGLVAWYNVNAEGTTHEVGGKAPNALGIYDTSGNVYEWCWDWYAASWTTGAKTDYRGPGTGLGRAQRGGGYGDSEGFLRVGSRIFLSPYNEYINSGFRLARSGE